MLGVYPDGRASDPWNHAEGAIGTLAVRISHTRYTCVRAGRCRIPILWVLSVLVAVRGGQVPVGNLTSAEFDYATALGAVHVVGDTTALAGLGAGVGKWVGIAVAPTTGMLYCAPYYADAVLMINPSTNTTDTTALAGLGAGGAKWHGIAVAPTTGMLYCAPWNAAAVLMINPSTNTTDTTALAGLGTDGGKWLGIAVAPTTGMLYCAPRNAASVLMTNPSFVDSIVL